MPLQYEVIHLFCAPQGYLAEIRRLDLPVTAPKAKRYCWLWIEDSTVSSLLFVGMSATPEQQRLFAEANFQFDEVRGVLRWNDGRSVLLEAVPSDALPKSLQWLVHEHLS